ncbi:hypothetical protein PsgB076_05268 [Pseudomonas savastanoi pv. glycinea str. B076]|uniref:Uncharacterized protein n=1 Tax=Pseudomonas savastanoi pv. glycinea TaxID=318 RepID=A0A3M3IRG8_PSESG|nr:hypothetical protein PsgB076_05268 [Pseudomonas savastanoi pv. glycinea str. B076]RML47931.1 hypothetical protein ALQ97_102917 [Pseudomonas savastanoi pv. glycinea]RMV35233.1 hypothetical protein ALP12_102313 [Pseudomonas savastanoi pv. phaseolicola]RML88000.1 hypothetical protein ALQ87_102666 [Pseudomonas savastanoi pv. glycinea]RMN01127.1 hypothetical protein ALQ69_103613 [Pseudomonas savastanoi pv. glycinea]
MHIVVARSFGLPVTMNRHEPLPVPVPVTARPDVAGTRRWFHFDYPLRGWLRRDDFFDVFMMYVWSLMDYPLFDTA